MKKPLLGMVQDILNDIDSDEVNSFTDTAEAFQVAQILQTTFNEMMTRKDWIHLRKMGTLNSLSDLDRPNYLVLPERVTRLDALSYNAKLKDEDRDIFRPVTYMYPDQFVYHCNNRNTDNDNVIVVPGIDGIRLNIINDKGPQYWTSFDDEHIVFDSYVAATNDTMIGSESQAEMYLSPIWEMDDTFIPDLPVEAFPALIAEAKSVAFVAIKEVANEKAEQQSVRQHKMLAQRGWKTKGGVRYQNYGRRGGKRYGRDRPIFNKDQYSG